MVRGNIKSTVFRYRRVDPNIGVDDYVAFAVVVFAVSLDNVGPAVPSDNRMINSYPFCYAQ